MHTGLTLDQINAQIADLDLYAATHWRGHWLIHRRRQQLVAMRDVWLKRDLQNELAQSASENLHAALEAKRTSRRLWAAPTCQTIRRNWRDVLFAAELMLSEKLQSAAKGIGLLSYKGNLSLKQRRFWAFIASEVEPILDAIASTRTQTQLLLEL